MTTRRTIEVCAVALCFWAAPQAASAASIDTAHRSGVEGYPIGIFGTGFGADQGSGNVTVLGTEATITKWTDTVIEAVVPTVAAAAGNLVVTASDATTAESPFEVYEIDPKFLVKPADLENLAYKKTFVLDGTHDDWAGDPTTFLGYNDGYDDGQPSAANFFAPISVAFDMESALSEDVWFSFFGDADWYTGGPIPTAYTIDASADSTDGMDGMDGTWETFVTVTDNDRKSRIHKVTLTGQRWIRMHITAVDPGDDHAGLNEVRVYKRKDGGSAAPDCIGLFGDSITYGDHRFSGDSAVHGLIQAARNNGTVPMTYIMGLIGAGSDVLHTAPYSIADVLEITPDLHYVGITLGTNVKSDNLQSFTTAVEDLLAADRVPILARMADTDPNTGYGTAEYKKQTVQEVDEIAAQYKLIPGPDFYTPFRQNIDTYLSDGTHHSNAGGVVVRQLWADTFQRVRESSVAGPEGGSGGTSGSGGSGAAPAGGAGGSATTTGGSSSVASGGASPEAGGTSSNPGADSGGPGASNASGCGCRTVHSERNGSAALLGVFSLLLVSRRRKA